MASTQYMVQTNFTAGEFSSLMRGRVDLAKYSNGLSISRNFISKVAGPLQKRTGTRYIGAAKIGTGNVRLIPFIYSIDKNYIIEMGDRYFRFFFEDGQILSVGSPYEVITPYLNADIPYIKYTQQENVMYFVHPNYRPYKLTRNADDDWSFSTIDIDGPYDVEGPDYIALWWDDTGLPPPYSANPGGSTGQYAFLNASENIFIETDVGRSIEVFTGNRLTADERVEDARYPSCILVEYSNASQFIIKWMRNATLTGDLSILSWSPTPLGQKSNWFFSVFGEVSDITRQIGEAFLTPVGWPSVVTLFENRLIYGAPDYAIQSIYASNLSEGSQALGRSSYDCFYKFVTNEQQPDDYSYSYTFVADTLNKIEWLISSKVLVAGTSSSEWRIGQPDTTSPITPNSVFAKRETSYGSMHVNATLLDNLVIFLHRNAQRLCAWQYNIDDGSFRAIDLTLLADHILESGATAMFRTSHPEERLYVVVEDGTLAVLTFSLDQAVVGWSKFETEGNFKDIVVTPPMSGSTQSDVWCLVERTNQVDTYYYIEKFVNVDIDDVNEWTYMDSSLIYTGNATSTLTGLDHLEGLEVGIWADGGTFPSQQVNGGKITLDRLITSAVVGLPFTAKMQTLPLESGVSGDGSATMGLGLDRRIDRLTIRFYKTLYGQYGPDEDNLKEIPFRSTYDLTDTQLSLFTGDKKLVFPGTTNSEAMAMVVSSSNTPMTVIALGFDIKTSDR